MPKFLVHDDGSLGARNDAYCHSIEHKLGIHGSPTCTMIFGDGKFGEEKGAIGYLIGEENKGLACMFTMMNNARLAVGMQGVAVCEAATQKAIAYAMSARRAARRLDRRRHEPDHRTSRHPAHAGDDEGADRRLARHRLRLRSRHRHGACDGRRRQQALAGARQLLTPIAKSFPTDCGVEVASLGVQVHGGMGFIEETGAARLYRDVRITPIYEGTNGIQAIDLIGRKLPQSNGAHVLGFIDELAVIVDQVRASNDPAFGRTADKLDAALADLREATAWLLASMGEGKMTEALAGATPYQRQFGLTVRRLSRQSRHHPGG